MRIRCTNQGTAALYVSGWMDKPVRFKNGQATVSEEVGARMVKEFSAIEEVKPAKARKNTDRKEVSDDE